MTHQALHRLRRPTGSNRARRCSFRCLSLRLRLTPIVGGHTSPPWLAWWSLAYLWTAVILLLLLLLLVLLLVLLLLLLLLLLLGQRLRRHFVQRRVNRIKMLSHRMSAELLGYIFNDDNYLRELVHARKMREKGIRSLALLMDVALMNTGEKNLTDCGLRAGEILQVIVCARSDFGQSVIGKWKCDISARMEGELGDSDSETETDSESEIIESLTRESDLSMR